VDHTTPTTQDDLAPIPASNAPLHCALVVAWCPGTQHLGSVSLFPRGSTPRVLGRGVSTGAGDERVVFHEQRPGAFHPLPPLSQRWLSRRQLLIVPDDQGLRIENLGKAKLLLNGAPTRQAEVRPGDSLRVGSQLLLYCTLRPTHVPMLRSYPQTCLGKIGAPDAHGLIGESPGMWRLRDQAALVANAPGHALILGESGTGKEHVARMIHELSARRGRKLVSRNAATFPATLIDAELFGNERNFPNPSMAARPGLVGEADGGSIFLDEIAELPEELQAHLLRVLDSHGEYQRLGATRRERSDFRLICATNRIPESLKHDLLGRLTLRVETPALAERREDIPFLLLHLLERAGRSTLEVRERYFDDWDGQRGTPRIDVELVEGLLMHRYRQNVRELDTLLWLSILNSPSSELTLVDEVRARMVQSVSAVPLTAAMIRQALARHGGNQSKTWQELGMPSRYALIRAMKRFGISGKDDDPPP